MENFKKWKNDLQKNVDDPNSENNIIDAKDDAKDDVKYYVSNIENDTVNNDYYRKVIITGNNLQLVLMNIKPGEEIGEEIHNADQFLRIESGSGKLSIDNEIFHVEDNFGIIIKSGSRHNLVNTGYTNLKLYSIYSPPQHKAGTIEYFNNKENNQE